ncbi:hypothetical protein FQR65_LT10235 [Abscondita terminalis]|nr:hypothetical protein FQR65_LT10235 [Abscondita terminalis]
MEEDRIYVTTESNINNLFKECLTHHDEEYPFYICDINDLIYKFKLWKTLFPRVEPHYAVKCNNHQMVIQVLAALGLKFDCASKFEIQQILSNGIDPSRIIFAHTCKAISHIKYAAEKNVDLMTFDSKEELYKIKAHFPDARTVLRIKFDDVNANCLFGSKFGCDPYHEAEELLIIALKNNLNVIGVSFHIGSGSKNPHVVYDAIKAARHVFDISEKLGHNLRLLDIGGGYPGELDKAILPYAKYINKALSEFFPDESVRVISEPGTFFVKSAFTLACCIQSVKEKNYQDSSSSYYYYLNDGVFGNFNAVMSYNLKVTPKPVEVSGGQLYFSTFWGPTCDPIDKVCDKLMLPKMNVGDWVMFDNIGDYSIVLITKFNGFGATRTYFTINYENMFFVKKTSNFMTKPSTSSPGNFFVTSLENQKVSKEKQGQNPKIHAKVEKFKKKIETKDSKSKKPFDKKKWRMKKYSKKYKLEQWENKRKKGVLQEYYKQIKDDEPKFNVQKIYEQYEEEDENENNLNKDTQESRDRNRIVEKTVSGTEKNKGKPFKKAHEEFQRIKEENNKRKEEIAKEKADRAEAKKRYKAQKLEKFKKLNKKTKKGQPIMKYRMEMLLEQIQKSMT